MAKGKGGGINIVLSADAANLKKGLAEARAALSQTADKAEADQKRLSEAAGRFASKATNAASFKQQARALENLALTYENMGQVGSKAMRDTLKQAGALQDQLGTMKLAIEAATPEGRMKTMALGISQVTQGIAGAQGAMHLLGISTEDAAAMTAKLQSLMAMAQGVEQLVRLEDTMAALAKNSKAAMMAYKAFSVLLQPGPLIAISAAIAAIYIGYTSMTDELHRTERAQKAVNDVLLKASSGVEKQRIEIGFYQRIINDTNKSEDERITALNRLKELVPSLADNEINNANALAKTNVEIKDYIHNAILRAQIDALIAKRAENNNKIADISNQKLNEGATIADKAAAAFRSFATGMDYAMLINMEGAKTLGKSLADLTTENSHLDTQLQKLESQYLNTQSSQDKYKQEADKTKTKVKELTKAVVDNGGAIKAAYAEWGAITAKGAETFKGMEQMGMPGAIDTKAMEENLINAQGLRRQGIKKLDAIQPDKSLAVYFSDEKDMRKQYRKFSRYADKMIDENGRRARQSEAQVNALNQGLQTAVSGSADAIGQLMEDMFSGSDTAVKDFGKSILMTVAGFMQTLGKAMIAAAVASDTFQKALLTNPVLAIAVGAGLVAAAGIVRGLMKKPFEEGKTAGSNSGSGSPGVRMFAEGGIISGPTVGMMGEYPGAKSNPEVVAPLNKLKDMIGGDMGGGQLMARISGQDLLIMLDRAETYRGRVR